MYHQFINRYKAYFPFFIISIIVLIVTVYLYLHKSSDEPIELVSSLDNYQEEVISADNVLLVDISGEVVNAGVYEMQEGDRIKDVIHIAGGFTEFADKDYIEKELNQAAIISDGQKIYIPKILDTTIENDFQNSDFSASKININSATISELDSLWGIGQIRAQDIISNRPYKEKEDLILRKIIPQSVYDKIQKDITI